MDLWQLKIFCKVVELKSFSKAAQAVNLSQPTVSSHIKDLENHLDCLLIERLAKQAVPTPSGRLLYHFATKLLALRDEAEKALFDYHGRHQGELPVGGSTIPGNYLLPAIIGAFRSQYPRIRIKLTIGDSREIVDKILAGQVELGLIGAHYDAQHVHYEALATETIRLVVAPGHRWWRKSSIHVDALREEPLIVREPGSGTRKTLEVGLQKIGCRLSDFNVIAEMGSTTAVLQGIKNGLGVSMLSMPAVQEDLRYETLWALEVEGLNLERQFFLASDNRRTESPLARVFATHLKASMRDFR
jgi:DNA-binding transcriptional LysR family regulator